MQNFMEIVLCVHDEFRHSVHTVANGESCALFYINVTHRSNYPLTKASPMCNALTTNTADSTGNIFSWNKVENTVQASP